MVSIRDLDKVREDLRKLLTHPVGGEVRLTIKNHEIRIQASRDGVSSHLLCITADGKDIFDCGGMGVANLTDEGLVFMIIQAMRKLEAKPS